jgi:hypothetical protein
MTTTFADVLLQRAALTLRSAIWQRSSGLRKVSFRHDFSERSVGPGLAR